MHQLQLGFYSVLTTLGPYFFNINKISMIPRCYLGSFRNISQNVQIWAPSECLPRHPINEWIILVSPGIGSSILISSFIQTFTPYIIRWQTSSVPGYNSGTLTELITPIDRGIPFQCLLYSETILRNVKNISMWELILGPNSGSVGKGTLREDRFLQSHPSVGSSAEFSP